MKNAMLVSLYQDTEGLTVSYWDRAARARHQRTYMLNSPQAVRLLDAVLSVPCDITVSEHGTSIIPAPMLKDHKFFQYGSRASYAD
ncbi:MAG: hypothetical protein GY767_13985 [Shimia sp.]|nr:hypothetical protein [Shimia sp.]